MLLVFKIKEINTESDIKSGIMNFDSIFGQWKHFKVSCRKQTECAPVFPFIQAAFRKFLKMEVRNEKGYGFKMP